MKHIPRFLHCLAFLLAAASMVSLVIKSLNFLGIPFFIAAIVGLILNIAVSLWLLKRL